MLCQSKYNKNPDDLYNVITLITILQSYVFSKCSFNGLGELEYYCQFVQNDDNLESNKQQAALIAAELSTRLSSIFIYEAFSYQLAAQNFFAARKYEKTVEYLFKLLSLFQQEITLINDKYNSFAKSRYDPDIIAEKPSLDGIMRLNSVASIIHNICLSYKMQGNKKKLSKFLYKYLYLNELEVAWLGYLSEEECTYVHPLGQRKFIDIIREDPLETYLISTELITTTPSQTRSVRIKLPSYAHGVNTKEIFFDGCYREIDYTIPSIPTPLIPLSLPSLNSNECSSKESGEHIGTQDNFESVIGELNSLVGLGSIKEDVKNLIGFIRMQKIREARGMTAVPVSLHLVFTGNPGTGKTTVARILAKLYYEIGVLAKGQLVEVDRSGLVAGYVGQTALKTQEKINEAIGGVLFIDEAYSLLKDGNDYGQEAIDTILKAMEDRRNEFVVIVAGYDEPMRKFIYSNPGLKSRFNKFFHFPDYSVDEMMEIFVKMCNQYGYVLSQDAEKAVMEKISQMVYLKDSHFANGRDVRNIFETIITRQATRVSILPFPTDEDISTIRFADVVM